ncbi:unnamed protein product, partial [Brassica napus]
RFLLCACRFRGYAFIHGQDFSFGWIVHIASGYHQTPARKVSRKIQLNSLLSPTRRRCLFGSSAAIQTFRPKALDDPKSSTRPQSGEASSATDRAQVPWKGAPERVRAPSCPDPVAPRGAVYESGCLGMQPQSGGKFRPRLNMGERPIANKYRESQRVLEIVGREADGAGDASWSDAERSNPSADRFGAWTDAD